MGYAATSKREQDALWDVSDLDLLVATAGPDLVDLTPAQRARYENDPNLIPRIQKAMAAGDEWEAAMQGGECERADQILREVRSTLLPVVRPATIGVAHRAIGLRQRGTSRQHRATRRRRTSAKAGSSGDDGPGEPGPQDQRQRIRALLTPRSAVR